MKPPNTLVSLIPLLTIAALGAQNTIVSPVQMATAPGSGGNVIPWSWGSPNHYMQIHSDITGSPKLVNRLSFRQSAGSGTFTGTRAQDIEVFMGHTRMFDLADFTFANNYQGPRIPVVTRKIITMGPQGPQGTPSAFQGMEIPLDVPFPYNGVLSIGWEVQLYAQPLTGTFNSCDADGSSQGSGSSTVIGTGCIATGRTMPATQNLSMADVGGHLTLAFQLVNGPPTAPTVLATASATRTSPCPACAPPCTPR